MDFSKITRAAGKVVLHLKKTSPDIMLIGGVVGVIGATVLACKATLKAKNITEETHELVDEVQEDALDRSLPEKYRKREVFKVYARYVGKLLKIYAPSIALGGLSIGLIVESHCVLNRRYVRVAAAYKAVEEAFKAYRERVKNIIGEEDERILYLGGEKRDNIVFKETNEDGEEVIITEHNGVVINPNYNHSPYAKFFDESSPEWKKNPEYNRMFLECQQRYANNLLTARGHVFLNEVYDMLGIPRTQAGAVIGWLKDSKDGDGYIDFGIFNAFSEKARDFINGYERSILLDFNVDGIIYDKI